MKIKSFFFLIGTLFALSFNTSATAELDSMTPKNSVTDECQGVKVALTMASNRLSIFNSGISRKRTLVVP